MGEEKRAMQAALESRSKLKDCSLEEGKTLVGLLVGTACDLLCFFRHQ